MKISKIISIVLILVFLVSVIACGCDSAKKDNNSSDSVGIDNSSNTSSETLSTPDNSSVDFDVPEKYSYYPVISEKMPVIYIESLNGSLDFATQYRREDKMAGAIDYTDALISVGNCDEEYILEDVEAEVKVRGNYTLNYSKKPFRIKFSKKQNLLGLNDGEKYKNWVLLADWKDLSMSNNTLAFYLGNVILGSDGYYCTDFRNVEVYINGEYWGVYLLAEQQEVKDGRMSVPEVEDGYMGNDIGFMFEYDSYYTEERDMPDGQGDPTFEISYGDSKYTQGGYTIKSDINDKTQVEFLRSYLENVFNISYAAVINDSYFKFNEDFSDIIPSEFTSVKETVGNVIDLQSLVDTFIINEIACDSDIAWSSFYLSVDMSKDGKKKLIFEAPWDFDSAFGMKKNFTATDGVFAAEKLNPWLGIFAKEEWFLEMVKEKWNELYDAHVFDMALKLVKDQKEVFEPHYARNYAKWSERVIKGNGEVTPELNKYKTQAQASDYLYNWLDKRIKYLNSVWGN